MDERWMFRGRFRGCWWIVTQKPEEPTLLSCDQAARTKLALKNSRSKLIHHQFQRFGEDSGDKIADMASTITSLLALCIALLAAASPIAQAVDDKALGDAAQLPVDGGDARRKLQQGGLVASIVCASSGWCDDGRGGRYYDEGRDEGRRRDYDRGDRGDYRDGDRDGRDGRGYGNGGYGRKLKQGGVVANIVCDATGGCNDGRGNHYYDQNRDERRNNGGYNNGGYNNNGYNNDRDRNNYGNNGNNYGRKLKQGGVVANIICDTLGNCNDNGRRYYDGGRDDRRRGDYNNGDRDRDGRGYGNNGYGNGGYGK
ncbi:hypothetical protein CVIRNUC_007798 [Coccomyxa viridis]|uniref:Uncharacterized protein n=1 Tax=Coccomyxa viridis TaxID=1274662 RepID=A0AAV1IF10_9CHLO|nr:hypothetical protein CVIRNUC_007798 [Coccomyxa viridis]